MSKPTRGIASRIMNGWWPHRPITQPRLQPGKALVQSAQAGQAYRLDVELEFAPRLVDCRGRADLDRCAVAQDHIEQLGLLPEKHAANLGLLVFEHEIAMPGRRAHKAGYFPTDPGEPQVALDQ